MHHLVTGSAGFLGANLAMRLLADGHQVTGLDNYHSGSRANTDMLREHPAFTFIEHDVVAPYDIPCDVLCNLACPASPPHYQKDPVYTLRISVLGTLHALENAERHKARVLHASTSEIYGDPLVHPQPETYLGNVSSTGPRACYDEGKRAAETLCADFTRLGRVDARIVRIFNTYGPYMRGDDGRGVTNLLRQAMSDKPLTIYGDGQQTRSFCYVDDLIEGFTRVLARGDNPGPINLGNPIEFTMLQLAETVQSLVSSALPLRFEPLPTDDPKQRCPDITKARRLLQGWEPEVQLFEGLARTLAYFRKLP
ncbi:MAG: SDR family oxidoreductase [Opitutales bacterium]|jgi:UDP-glucuronate decarboxylase|nr:SDR family oxidoreductase [Opitutales bacterium]MDP4775101.1 SDR family oxidoreductase [Opitutales bacterium]MDP4787059.1 SDR family oxidoreductase [Opitutales bacterium]MDP4894122.1 SDR family oxidoreductase [Opitutales bacterium]